MKNILILVVFAALFSSCSGFFSQKIEADPPEFDKSLVFHQIVANTDTSIRLVLSRNFGVFETVDDYSKWYIKGAVVEWWEDGQKTLLLSPLSADSAFVYVGAFPTPLQVGKKYEIRVSHPDFNGVIASQELPRQVALPEQIALKRNIPAGDPYTIRHELSFVIKDAPGEENYYELSMERLYPYVDYIGQDPNGEPIFDTTYLNLRSFFETENDPNLVNSYAGSALISDKLFDGQDYKFIGRFGPAFYDSTTGDSLPYTLVIRSVTADYYKWSSSAKRQNDNSGNPFAEPTAVYSNLLNGLGIFGMYTERKTEVK